jgi:aconitase A
MKKIFVLLLLTLLVSGALFAQIKSGSSAWVSAKKADIKSSTGFFAGTKGSLELGAEVSVLSINGKWAEVRSVTNTSLSGWMTASNLSARRIVASGTTASASEVALAAKGFSQEVENAYKTEGNLNYADVDKTEAITVSQDDLYKFVTEGHLNTGE